MYSDLHPCHFTPWKKAPSSHSIGGWLISAAHLNTLGKRKTSCPSRALNHNSLVFSLMFIVFIILSGSSETHTLIKNEMVFSNLILQLYMTTSEYKDEKVEEIYDKIKEILKRMGKVRQTPSYWGIATV